MSLREGRGDSPAQAVADHEYLYIGVCLSYDIDVSVQVFHIVVEALDVAPSSLGAAVSAVVQSAYKKSCGNKLVYEVQVTSAVLSQAMYQEKYGTRLDGRPPALVKEPDASCACKIACVLLDCHALIPYSALVFLALFTLLGAAFVCAEAAVFF